MKKIFSSLTIGLVLSVMLSPLAQAAFTDVGVNHFHYDAIFYVEGQGIVSGYPDGSFQPDRTINRAEFTKIIVGAIVNEEDLERGLPCFSDVKSSEWYSPYVCKAKVQGWIKGYPDKTFRPGSLISFVEAAKIISEAFELPLGPGNTWYKPYVDTLAQRNAIPVSVSSFTQYITRGEMAEMIYRIRAQVTNKESTSYTEIQTGASTDTSNDTWTAPQDREISISARNYQFTPSSFEVNMGDTVNITLTSYDRRYDFSLPGYGLSKTVNGEESISFSFEADERGEFDFTCKLYCQGHSEAKGQMIVR